jgi:hypothetical protein
MVGNDDDLVGPLDEDAVDASLQRAVGGESVPAVVEAIRRLENVRLVGVTAFPCIRYDANPDAPATEPIPNFYTIMLARLPLTYLSDALYHVLNYGDGLSAIRVDLAAWPIVCFAVTARRFRWE